jgi:hypothetical protein
MPSVIALIDRNFTDMISYYKTFSSDETWTGHIEIQPRDVHPFHYVSFEALLVQLRNQLRNGRTEFLVGTHGYPTQLPYPVIQGTDVAADVQLLNDLELAAQGNNAAKANLLGVQSSKNKNVFANAARLEELLAVLREVRSNRIEHLEIRGCNIGAGSALQALHQCLNSKYTVAPTVTLMSGVLSTHMPNKTAAQLLTAVNKMAPVQRVYSKVDCLISVGGNDSGDLALGMRWTEVSVHPHRFTGALNALSMEAVKGWTKTALESSFYYVTGKVPPGGGYRLGLPLPLIALWTPNQSKPYLFPGDGYAYLGNLAAVATP